METQNNTKTSSFDVPEIVCGGCAASIKNALGKIEGISKVDVDVATKSVTVQHAETISREAIAGALDRAGYSTA